MKPIRYDDWARRTHHPLEEFGLKSLTTDAVLKRGINIYDALGNQIGKAIARYLSNYRGGKWLNVYVLNVKEPLSPSVDLISI